MVAVEDPVPAASELPRNMIRLDPWEAEYLFLLASRPAVLDFVGGAEVEIVRSPYIPESHWHTDYGSLAHLRKPVR